MPDALQAVGRFAGHVAAASMIFVLVCLPAALIHLFVHIWRWPPDMFYILAGITILEYAIFVIDGLVFVAFLLISAYRLVKELLA